LAPVLTAEPMKATTFYPRHERLDRQHRWVPVC
jgi:hypothetical protein